MAPGARLLTETNVPHAENISYFGDGNDEAHLVYQFALPPLVLHSFVAGSTARLTEWAAGVGPVSPTATWFNFLASHDGIGLRATEGILDDDERAALVERTRAHGGRVSMASRPGRHADRLRAQPQLPRRAVHPRRGRATPPSSRPRRWQRTASCSPSSACRPIYSTRWSGRLRTTRAWRPAGSTAASTGPSSTPTGSPTSCDHDPRRRAVFSGLRHLLDVRRQHEAFSPFGSQRVERLDDRVFALRRAAGTPDELLCVTNVTAETVTLGSVLGHDVLTDRPVEPLTLGPWGYAWVRPKTSRRISSK